MMLPFLRLGDLYIPTFQITAALALVVGGSYAYDRLLRLAIPARALRPWFLMTVLGTALAAHGMSWLITQQRVARDGWLAHPEGLSITWGLIGGAAVVAVACWRNRLPLLRVLDAASPAVLLGLAIGRIGCFAAGCCNGKEAHGWLAMYLPDEHGVWLLRYPTQFISAGLDLAFFIILLTVEQRLMRRPSPVLGQAQDGWVFLLAVALFGLKRFGIAFLRTSATPLLGALSWMQLSALLALAAVAAIAVWRLRTLAARAGGPA
jgi:phosphatidylglycerol:prolipoprotein diacylglycerol transferase